MAQRFTASQVNYYIFSGETSGDARGAELLSALKNHSPLATVHGVPGPQLRALGVKHSITMESFQVMGFIDVVKSLPKLYRLFFHVKTEILNLNPEVVIMVDYADFSLRMAKHLRKAGYKGKIVQYVSPSVWAWKKHRIAHIEKNLDLLLTILPFEPAYFDQTKICAKYVGHPLTQKNNEIPSVEWTPPFDVPFIAIFPGSRETEISKNLPLQLAVAQETKRPIAISCAHEKFKKIIELITPADIPIISSEHTAELMNACTYAIATSGTICLELALKNIPTVCTYAIRPFDEFLATKIFKINLPYYCIVNIIAGREVFPELFGSRLSFHSLSIALRKVIEGEHACDTRAVREMLGTKEAAKEAAQEIALLHTS